MIRSTGAGHLRSALDAVLRANVPHSASYADNAELIALASVGDGAATRVALMDALRALETPAGSAIALGPVGRGIDEAPWSLAEARRTLDTDLVGGGVVDAEAFAVERLAEEHLDPATREGFVQRQLGAVVEHDQLRRSELLRTLTVWLDTGCNTAQSRTRTAPNGSPCTTGCSGSSSCAGRSPGNGKARRVALLRGWLGCRTLKRQNDGPLRTRRFKTSTA